MWHGIPCTVEAHLFKPPFSQSLDYEFSDFTTWVQNFGWSMTNFQSFWSPHKGDYNLTQLTLGYWLYHLVTLEAIKNGCLIVNMSFVVNSSESLHTLMKAAPPPLLAKGVFCLLKSAPPLGWWCDISWLPLAMRGRWEFWSLQTTIQAIFFAPQLPTGVKVSSGVTSVLSRSRRA